MSIANRPWHTYQQCVEIDPKRYRSHVHSGDYAVATFIENDDADHLVACVNAIHAAGIPPEAIAADPRCIERLVAVVKGAAIAWGWQRSELHPAHREHAEGCEQTGEAEDCFACFAMTSATWAEDALRACGIPTPTDPT